MAKLLNAPVEVLKINPEGLEIANKYLELQDITEVSVALNVPIEYVGNVLKRREIKSYIDNVFFNLGYNNRFKLRTLMDKLIDEKVKEMSDDQTTSKKDIAELMALSLKITEAETRRLIEEQKLEQSTIKSQTNIQINSGGDNYDSLIERLIRGDK